MLRLVFAAATAVALHAQVAVPSVWEGSASGQVHGREFRIPVSIELSAPLTDEKNPFHLHAGANASGTASAETPGVFLFSSASRAATTSGFVTLQYAAVRRAGSSVTATLTDTHTAEAAGMNTFTAPNVSAERSSPVMKDVLTALGPSEIHLFHRGAVLKLRIQGRTLTGSLEGQGSSVLGSSGSPVEYRCEIKARRVK